MEDQSRNYRAVLSDLQARRSRLYQAVAATDQAITAIEQILSEFDASQSGNNSAPQSNHFMDTDLATRPEPAPATQGPYSKMTLGDATAAFIRSVGRPQTTRKIVEALKQGGISSNSKNLYTTVYNTLTKRSSRESSDIVKSGKIWTLREFQHH